MEQTVLPYLVFTVVAQLKSTPCRPERAAGLRTNAWSGGGWFAGAAVSF